MRRLSAGVAMCSGVLLAACGGGGSGGSDDGGPSLAPTVAITAANQVPIARVSFDDSQAIAQTPLPLAAPGRAGAQAVGAGGLVGPVARVDAAIRLAVQETFASRRSVASATPAGRVRAAGTQTFTQPCANGGSVTLVADDADSNGDVSAGDSLRATFSQCSDTPGAVMNGAMTVAVQSVPANTATQLRFTGTIAFEQLSLVEGADRASLDGSVAIDATETDSGTHVGVTIGAGGLASSITNASGTQSVVYDAGSGWVVDSNGSSTTLHIDGSFGLSAVGGRVAVATVQPLVFAAGDAHASSGQMLVTGASGSRLRITALDNAHARLELDANGDATYEKETDIAWDDRSAI